jgi:hypothetical protein
MGAWGPGIFENDTACDFVAEIAASDGYASLDAAFDRVLAVLDSYLEAPDAEQALAAAEIVSRLRGGSGAQTSYSASIDEWILRQQAAPSEDLAEKARRCIVRILSEPSEALELWTGSGEFEAWKTEIDGLSMRL